MRALVRSEDGVAALEFALVSMLFMMLLYGIITYGFLFGLDQSITHAAEEGARAAISKTTATEQASYAKDTALDRLAWLGANISPSDVTATVAPCTNDTSVNCVRVSIVYPWSTRPLVPKFVGVPTPTQIDAQAIVQVD